MTHFQGCIRCNILIYLIFEYTNDISLTSRYSIYVHSWGCAVHHLAFRLCNRRRGGGCYRNGASVYMFASSGVVVYCASQNATPGFAMHISRGGDDSQFLPFFFKEIKFFFAKGRGGSFFVTPFWMDSPLVLLIFSANVCHRK